MTLVYDFVEYKLVKIIVNNWDPNKPVESEMGLTEMIQNTALVLLKDGDVLGFQKQDFNCCTGPPHPNQLSIVEIRKKIPHSLGEHEANKQGFRLCNGHCSWNKKRCSGVSFVCLNCYYLECWGCAEDFDDVLYEKILGDDLNGWGIDPYCRNCGSHGSIKQVRNFEEALKEIQK